MLPAPGDPLRLPQLQQESQLLGEQLVVVVQVLPEERVRLDEAPPPRHDLGAPAAQLVERGEVLEDAHRIVGTEHRHRTRQADARRAPRRGGEHYRRRRDREVGAMMLAHAKDVEPDLIGQLDLLHEVAQTVRACSP